MNKKQRSSLSKCAQQLGRIVEDLSLITDVIEGVKNEEEDKLNNLPDSFRESEMGCEIEEGVEKLDEVLDMMNDCAYSDAADLLNEF